MAVQDKVELQGELIAELLKERKRDRRAGILKAGLFLLATVAYFWWMSVVLGVNLGSFGAAPTGAFATAVNISGTIGPGKDASFEALSPLLKQAFENADAKGVVLRINSPGGTPVQASLIHDLIVELKRKHNKPVIAVGEDMMTSGAYLIAVAADQLVVNRSTVTGSIGVISAGFGFSGLMDKLGVERRVATAGESKNLLDPFSPVSSKDVVQQRKLLAAIHTHFKEIVVKGRGERLHLDTPGLFEGTVWTGEDAVAAGIVDELGDVNSAAKKHLGVDKVVAYAPRKPAFASMLENMGVKAIDSLFTSQLDVPLALVR